MVLFWETIIGRKNKATVKHIRCTPSFARFIRKSTRFCYLFFRLCSTVANVRPCFHTNGGKLRFKRMYQCRVGKRIPAQRFNENPLPPLSEPVCHFRTFNFHCIYTSHCYSLLRENITTVITKKLSNVK